MILQWKEFEINLSEFNKFLKDNITSADGIVADPSQFEIIELTPFTEIEIELVENYYNSLIPLET